MLIGIMSDSHDRIEAVRAAIEKFNLERVDLVLHAGDIVSPFTVKEFGKLNCKIICVKGNNDGDLVALRMFLEKVGGELKGDFFISEVGGKKIVLTHGVWPEVVEALIISGKYDVVISGHSHEASIRKQDNVLVINPGSCSYPIIDGIVTIENGTVAILDLDKMSAKILKL
ncbi:MAG: metallophosphoesterase [Candidatus Jordarchaeaceae archaeon]